MKKAHFPSSSLRIYFIGFSSVLFAIVAMILSVNYQYPDSPACGGMLGAGFPVLYLCDNGGGGSPADSWGKITSMDVINGGIVFRGFLINSLFFAVLFFLAMLIVKAVFHRLIVSIAILSLISFLAILRANPDPNFWFILDPPVPPGALHVRYSDGGSMGGGYRIIYFETDQPAEDIRQYYRGELPKRGWEWLCAPTQLEQPGCPLGLSHVTEQLADAFSRADEPSQVRQIDVTVFIPGENLANSQNRLVEVVEYRYPVSAP